jgi:hypothetical protein
MAAGQNSKPQPQIGNSHLGKAAGQHQLQMALQGKIPEKKPAKHTMAISRL